MAKTTVTCACGRTMNPTYGQAPGDWYRCGCGVKIRVFQPHSYDSDFKRCSIRGCLSIKWDHVPVCFEHAQSVAKAALQDEYVCSEVAEAVGYAEFRRHKDEARRKAEQERQRKLAELRRQLKLKDYNVVYYVTTSPGVVKIGTTRHLPSRMAALGIGGEDAVLAAEPGTYQLETARHHQFQHLRVLGPGSTENFQLTDELQQHIDQVVEQYGPAYELSEQLVQEGLAAYERARSSSDLRASDL